MTKEQIHKLATSLHLGTVAALDNQPNGLSEQQQLGRLVAAQVMTTQALTLIAMALTQPDLFEEAA